MVSLSAKIAQSGHTDYSLQWAAPSTTMKSWKEASNLWRKKVAQIGAKFKSRLGSPPAPWNIEWLSAACDVAAATGTFIMNSYRLGPYGQMVNVLAYNSDNPSSNLAEAYSFLFLI